MPGILEHPQAQELLRAASITSEEVPVCSQRLLSFLQRCLPLFKRSEHRTNTTDIPHGWISADTEFGRVAKFRASLRERKDRNLLDVWRTR
jgi:hypothetical protein